jgi:mRNA interferase MazF
MGKFLRGDIVWCQLNPTIGHEQKGLRPVLIVSADIFNDKSGTVIGIPITSQPQRAPFPLTLELTSTVLEKKSWVKISQIRILSTNRLREKITMIDRNELNKIIQGLNMIIDPT